MKKTKMNKRTCRGCFKMYQPRRRPQLCCSVPCTQLMQRRERKERINTLTPAANSAQETQRQNEKIKQLKHCLNSMRWHTFEPNGDRGHWYW